MSNELSEKVIGLTSEHKFKLSDAGIVTTDELITRASTKEGRRKLSKEIGIKESEILEWMNRIDLMRVKGVDPYYADLLEESGVDTVIELAKRDPENLYGKLSEVVDEMPFIVDEKPAIEQVNLWVENAKKLERLIEY
jgi:predicted RecB family nuclease